MIDVWGRPENKLNWSSRARFIKCMSIRGTKGFLPLSTYSKVREVFGFFRVEQRVKGVCRPKPYLKAEVLVFQSLFWSKLLHSFKESSLKTSLTLSYYLDTMGTLSKIDAVFRSLFCFSIYFLSIRSKLTGLLLKCLPCFLDSFMCACSIICCHTLVVYSN